MQMLSVVRLTYLPLGGACRATTLVPTRSGDRKAGNKIRHCKRIFSVLIGKAAVMAESASMEPAKRDLQCSDLNAGRP